MHSVRKIAFHQVSLYCVQNQTSELNSANCMSQTKMREQAFITVLKQFTIRFGNREPVLICFQFLYILIYIRKKNGPNRFFLYSSIQKKTQPPAVIIVIIII